MDPASTRAVLLVSHTHWDREWYRTFEAFRARLVDTVDRVLDLLAADPGWKFLLDGQAIVVEDYLAVRPHRRAELEAAVASASAAGRPVLLDFYADWCTSCKTIEREVFGDPRVGRALDGVLLLRADVTRSDVAQRAFMQRLQVMGPPTLMLYAPQGEERRDQRLVGEFGPEALLERLQTGSTGS